MIKLLGMMNKREYMELVNPGVTFDCALPQPWCDEVWDIVIPYFADVHVTNGHPLKKYEVYPAKHFVWLYPKGWSIGKPFPVSDVGVEILYILHKKGRYDLSLTGKANESILKGGEWK